MAWRVIRPSNKSLNDMVKEGLMSDEDVRGRKGGAPPYSAAQRGTATAGRADQRQENSHACIVRRALSPSFRTRSQRPKGVARPTASPG